MTPGDKRAEAPEGYSVICRGDRPQHPYSPEVGEDNFKTPIDAIAACWAHHDAIADRARAEERAFLLTLLSLQPHATADRVAEILRLEYDANGAEHHKEPSK